MLEHNIYIPADDQNMLIETGGLTQTGILVSADGEVKSASNLVSVFLVESNKALLSTG